MPLSTKVSLGALPPGPNKARTSDQRCGARIRPSMTAVMAFRSLWGSRSSPVAKARSRSESAFSHWPNLSESRTAWYELHLKSSTPFSDAALNLDTACCHDRPFS
eukprot:CAMPEP_0178440054 /NCGR_PEP_ID=MMETSP0689_2-20121128/36533_1 /TAXON_ID=160604 /ORGANISM="Amphidinium massartii, Strain CS-259" /LENGTH=104 /DNA_ID=CAMNT_0020062721 /DNA_START=1010 /DNA_END=1324 /DNA_ORIENTATION=-